MSAAAKRAQKRRAKKEDAANHAAIGLVEQVAATMSVAGASTAAAAVTITGSGAPAAASSSSSSATPASVDPRVQLKELGIRAFADKHMAEAIRQFTLAIEAPVTVDTDAAAAANAASSSIASVASSASSLPPFLATVYANRSAAYAAQYDWSLALADALKAIELAPRWSKGYYRRGQALEGQMHFQQAREAYAAGLLVDPADAMLQRSAEAVDSMLEEMNTTIPEQAADNPEEDKFDTMINWLIAGKARFPALYLKYYSEDYRGVHSLQRIGKDEIVLEVPLSHIMTSEVAKASDIGQKIVQSGVELNSTHSFLACYLLQERHNPNSFWAPYISVLPQHYRNMPIFFQQDELAYLKGSLSLGKIADRHSELAEEYNSIVKHVPSFAQYPLEEFIWARSVVITRIFGLMIGGNKTDGLVPMADMLNHRRPRETSWTYDDTRGAFTITSLRGMLRGEQIYDSYGRKCNSRFFVNYGFSLEENEDNQAVMWFTLPTSDTHYQMKVRLLGTSKIAVTPNQPKRFQIPVDYNEDVTKECFAFLRFVHAKDSELMLLSSNEKFDIKKIEPISIRNEMEVINDLAIAAQTSMSQFDSSIEDDNKLLADPKLTSNIRNAVLMRRGEKQVLQYYMDLVQEVRPLIDMPWPQFKKYSAKCYGQNKGRFDNYITTVIVPLKKNHH